MKVVVKFIDFNKVSNDVRRDISCYRGKELVHAIKSEKVPYIVVATYDTREQTLERILSEAWKLTNTVEEPWYLNSKIDVKEVAKTGIRSSMIGDIVEVEGITYMVDSFGWADIDL